MPDLDPHRLAKAIESYHNAEGNTSDGIREAIAAWEASAPVGRAQKDDDIAREWARKARTEAGSFAFGPFLAGWRACESRTRARPEPQSPRSGMTKAEREALLALLDWAQKYATWCESSCDFAATIRKEMGDE